MSDFNLIELANDVLKNCDIVEVISSRIKVIQSGRNYKAICPFHDDKNPSLMISKEKQIFKCFVCGKSGNAITFIQNYDKIPFFDAMKEVARISGYSDERLEKKIQKKSSISPEMESVYDCLTAINAFYETALYQSEFGKKGLQYLRDRGLDDKTIKHFHIGYSLDDGINIIRYLQDKSFSIKTIERTGIGHINSSNMTIKDNNSGRVIFPIMSKDGQVLGFSARKIVSDPDISKYINTESTLAFNKGNILYNLNYAKDECRTCGYVYILEGFMDVIACYRAGINSAVALMGTALTKDHIKELRLLNTEIRICLDLDNAGQNNTLLLCQKLIENGLNFKVVNQNVDFHEKDSDEIFSSYGQDGLKKYLENLLDYGEWLLNYYAKTLNLTNNNDKKKLVNQIMPHISNMKSKFDVESLINKLSFYTGYSKSLLMEYLDKYKKNVALNNDDKWFDSVVNSDKKLTKLELAQFKIIKYMLSSKEAIEVANTDNLYLPSNKYRNIANILYDFILSLPSDKNKIDYDDVINFVAVNNNYDNKDRIINDISEVVLDSRIKLPPFTKEEMNESIKDLNSIRQAKREEETLNSIDKTLDPIKRAEIAKSVLQKRKDRLNKKE